MKVALKTLVRTVLASAAAVCLAAACVAWCGCSSSSAGSGNSSSSAGGKAVATQTVQYRIEGMHCDGCASAVTEALKALPGVQSADVSFEKKTATLVANPAQVSPGAIAKAVAAAGYKASPLAGK